MGKPKTDYETDALVADWISVNKAEDPVAWEAWRVWRADELGSHIEPDSFTVPTPFPPATVAAAREYIAIVRQLRAAIGWKSSKSRINSDVSAWRAS
jgi:hypothetical protein